MAGTGPMGCSPRSSNSPEDILTMARMHIHLVERWWQGWAICKENTRRLGLYEAVTFRCWSLSPGFSQYTHVILGLWFALYLPVVSIREKERELLLCFFIYIFSHKCKWRTCALEVVSGFFYSNIFVLL